MPSPGHWSAHVALTQSAYGQHHSPITRARDQPNSSYGAVIRTLPGISARRLRSSASPLHPSRSTASNASPIDVAHRRDASKSTTGTGTVRCAGEPFAQPIRSSAEALALWGNRSPAATGHRATPVIRSRTHTVRAHPTLSQHRQISV